MNPGVLIAINLGAACALMVVAWAVCTARRNAGLIDGFWGLGFVVIAWMTVALAPSVSSRGWLMAALVTVWGLRLSVFLFRRNWGKPEDRRYAAMREKHGDAFARRSFTRVFLLQAGLAWFISLPVQVAVFSATPASLTILDWIGASLTLGGILFESVADAQLAAFTRNPANKGQVLDRGLWRYSRHPNYFGEFITWWGIYLLACSTGIGAATILSPLMISVLLIRVSGVPLLEKDITARRPGYAEYLRRTPAFVPWFPRRTASASPPPMESAS